MKCGGRHTNVKEKEGRRAVGLRKKKERRRSQGVFVIGSYRR